MVLAGDTEDTLGGPGFYWPYMGTIWGHSVQMTHTALEVHNSCFIKRSDVRLSDNNCWPLYSYFVMEFNLKFC